MRNVFLIFVGILIAFCVSFKLSESFIEKHVIVTLSMQEDDDGSCTISADITNNTNYHLNNAEIDFGTFPLDLPSVAANSTASGVAVASENPPYAKSSVVNCATAAQGIDNNKNDATVSVCSMDGMSEGDCQKAVKLETKFDYDALQAADAKYLQQMNSDSLKLGGYNIPCQGSAMIQGGCQSVAVYPDGNMPPSTDAPLTALDDSGDSNLDRTSQFFIVQIAKDPRGVIQWYRIRYGVNTFGWLPANSQNLASINP